ncbi:HdeD family acid-resistance protein [Corynebacterium halotolerans]|uniref:HdeD family acid-resistance protein n=1 Tax=Corynebacterium halotolerans YIM 70093 = DSM 44683 TaxID=1121362 RepID=M1MZY2_9CORY|nr:DUF308 domain-containing protein [Corynebacterium halotolerans]AGF73279.1 hypothetical protein A605_11395 [Corynebacterium halotolerans YIM 70093 = DSM 44683]
MPGHQPTAPLAELRSTGFASLLLRGILAVLLGVIMLIAPGLSVGYIAVFLVVVIGLWLILDGIASCLLASRERKHDRRGWGWTLAGGAVAILIGCLALIFPLSTALAGGTLVLWFLAAGLILRGALELGDRRLGGRGTAIGIVNILFGFFIAVMLLLNPAAVLLAMVWVAAVYGIVFGVLSIVVAFRVRDPRR